LKEKPARKRKPPTQLILSEEFKQHMEERMKSEEGKLRIPAMDGRRSD
jgi:hypothetical protein